MEYTPIHTGVVVADRNFQLIAEVLRSVGEDLESDSVADQLELDLVRFSADRQHDTEKALVYEGVGSHTLTLARVAAKPLVSLFLVVFNLGSGALTVKAESGEFINGLSSFSLPAGFHALLRTEGVGWRATVRGQHEGSVRSYSGTATLTADDFHVKYTSTGHTLTLPAANARGTGVAQLLFVQNAGSGTLTLARAGSDTIDGSASSKTVAVDRCALLMSDGGTKWNQIAGQSAAAGRHILEESALTFGFRHDPRYVDQVEEFLGGGVNSGEIGKLGWAFSGANPPTVTYQDSVEDHFGIIRLQDNINGRIYLGDAVTRGLVRSVQLDRFTWIVRVPTVTSIQLLLGIGQDISSSNFGTDGVWFELVTAASANWRGVTRASSTSNAQASDVAVNAGSWYVLEAVRLSNGNWEFYVNGTLKVTSSANLPTANLSVGVFLNGTVAARQVDLDLFRLRSIQLGNRFT